MEGVEKVESMKERKGGPTSWRFRRDGWSVLRLPGYQQSRCR